LNPKSTKEKETPPMRKSITEAAKQSNRTYDMLEEMVRLKVQEYIQDILEEEVEAFLGRKKSERIKIVDGIEGYRNGHGKPKKFTVMNGTITVQRPRVRGTEERFESKIIPYFKRRTKEVGQLLPELYLHGLAKGDFELALRGLLGEGAPLSASSIQRLKGRWQLEYEEWKGRDLSKLQVVYQWADGIYVKAGLEKDKAALLIIIGALTNVLDSLPKRIRSEAGEYLKRIPYAETLKECVELRDAFVERYRKDYPKAAEKLLADWDRMVTFYSFPKEHWVHLRTTNVVESPFSSVRLRTDAAKRFKKVQNATAMIWKLLQVAEKSFRTLKGYWLLPNVYAGEKFVDGVMKHESKALERMTA